MLYKKGIAAGRWLLTWEDKGAAIFEKLGSSSFLATNCQRLSSPQKLHHALHHASLTNATISGDPCDKDRVDRIDELD